MLLLVAALAEEARVAHGMCGRITRAVPRNPTAWCASRGATSFHVLKCGVGPASAQGNLQLFLQTHRVSAILAFGYAGALDPSIRIGDLIAARKAIGFGENVRPGTPLERMETEGFWQTDTVTRFLPPELPPTLRIVQADMLTSPFIIGDPTHKRLLYDKFHASAIDMETAALARTAAANRLSFGCIRAITDEAADTFLAPFSYDPTATLPVRAIRIAGAGNWIQRYRQWKERSAVARDTLRRFLELFFSGDHPAVR
jgi:nucleoside phosphorylase